MKLYEPLLPAFDIVGRWLLPFAGVRLAWPGLRTSSSAKPCSGNYSPEIPIPPHVQNH
jgi:hypothetical protein